MVTMTPGEWQMVGSAIVAWSGWGHAPWPLRDDRLVARRFGEQAAALLLPLLRAVVAEFYSSDARATAIDLTEMERLCVAHFSGKHPELSQDAVRALAWCYTFDNR